MKKSLLLMMILFMPIVLAQTWTSKEEFQCDGCCIENDGFSLKTTITNNGTETLWTGEAQLVDKTGEAFASYKPLSGVKYGLLPGKSINLEYSGKWPKPSTKSSLLYKQCLRTGTLVKWYCEEKYKERTLAEEIDFQCYKDSECPTDKICKIETDCTSSKCETIPISEKCGRIVRDEWRPYECCQDTDCKEEQYCLNNNCEQVECTTCGYVEGHECVKFECCKNTDCPPDKTCTDHGCVEIKCGYCEYADNYECKKFECCKDSECGEDEKCEENKCQKISCENGYVEGRKCIRYPCITDDDCETDAKCENGFCTELGCGKKEVIEGHKCRAVSTSLGYVKDHKYVPYFSKEAYNDNKAIYISLSVILLFIIILLVSLKVKRMIKEKRWRGSYILINPKKKNF